MEAVAAAVIPLLRACTRNHQIGTLAERSPMVLKVVPQAVSAGLATLTPQRWLAADSYEVADYKRVSVALQSGIQAWVYVSA